MIRLLILLGIAASLYLGLRWFLRTPPEQVAARLRKTLPILAVLLLAILVLSGRLNWLFAFAAALIPALQRLARLLELWRWFKRGGEGMGTSRMRTASLELRMDPASGRLDGQVLRGPGAGRRLSDLDLARLRELLAWLQAQDPASVPLLRAYLDRTWPGWAKGEDAGAGAEAAGPMTREQAYRILGLEPGADRDQIVAAHRRLMQRLHPDRGGSTWLAAQVNRAKDLLLGA